MIKPSHKAKNSHPVVALIKNFIGRLRQQPDTYPIRYYKKNRRFRHNFNEQAVK